MNHTQSVFTGRHCLALLVALMMGLMLFATPSLAADLAGRDGTTTADISFIEGELEFSGDVGGSGMHFTFGEHTIPFDTVNYPAENADGGLPVSHILPVEDARYQSGDWHVTVELTPFGDTPTSPTSAFDAIIRLANPVVANQNASAGTTGLTVESPISIASGGGETLVMTADDTLPRGLFTATWTNEKVTLNIDETEVGNITPVPYAATLTWTLNLGPM